MTAYGQKNQTINLNYGDTPNNDYDKILQYNNEVGTSAKLPMGTCRSGYDDLEDAKVMTDMWVKVEEKIKMCRYDECMCEVNDPDEVGDGIYPPIYIIWKYYGNGNHIILKPYKNSKGEEYIMIKGKRHYLDQLQGSKTSVSYTGFEWDYHYHYGNEIPALMGLPHVEEIKEVLTTDIVINKEVLRKLIKTNKDIYNKNIELSIALMKTTATLEDMLNV
tara:strand:+ start:346 stop:1002 length:657 start_codon:yes stop_codon:yes gene_type:complete